MYKKERTGLISVDPQGFGGFLGIKMICDPAQLGFEAKKRKSVQGGRRGHWRTLVC